MVIVHDDDHDDVVADIGYLPRTIAKEADVLIVDGFESYRNGKEGS